MGWGLNEDAGNRHCEWGLAGTKLKEKDGAGAAVSFSPPVLFISQMLFRPLEYVHFTNQGDSLEGGGDRSNAQALVRLHKNHTVATFQMLKGH